MFSPVRLSAATLAAGSVPEAMVKPTFEDVYAEHFDYVWQSARRLGVRPGDVDDVVQDVFLTVHKLLPRYEARNAVRGWLYAIVVRTAFHHHRSLRRRGATPDGERIEAVPDTRDGGPERSAEQRESARLLEQLLDGLDPEKRAVLILADLEQKSNPEISEILEINLNTVASRLRVAREQIQAGIDRHKARDRWRSK